MVQSVRRFGYDYLKVNPRATYYSEAWGCRYRRSTDPLRGPEPEAWILSEPRDLGKVRPIDGTAGPFGEQLRALELIASELGQDVPFIQTVFSPLSVLGRLARDRESVRSWMIDAPDAIHGALTAITETLIEYAKACLEAGAEGIFFATTEWATYDVLTDSEYDAFGRTYDLQVLQPIIDAPLNVLHVCRPNNMLEHLLDYPVAAFNWAIHAPGNPALGAIRGKTDKVLMGGVDERHALLQGTPQDVQAQVVEAMRQTGGLRFMLGPGCSIAPNTPPENIEAALASLRSSI
jgi:uroporphyrinogen decarboxylase